MVATLALLNNMVEIRSDARRLCYSYRRPLPVRGHIIGHARNNM